LTFGLVLAQSLVGLNLLLRQSLAKSQKSSLPPRSYIIAVNALRSTFGKVAVFSRSNQQGAASAPNSRSLISGGSFLPGSFPRPN